MEMDHREKVGGSFRVEKDIKVDLTLFLVAYDKLILQHSQRIG